MLKTSIYDKIFDKMFIQSGNLPYCIGQVVAQRISNIPMLQVAGSTWLEAYNA